MNEICIDGLMVETRIGVPAEERAKPQQVEVNVVMTSALDFATMGDEVERTIDYHAVVLAIQKLAATGERRLIETLAADIAAMVRREYGAARVRVEVRKFILPETRWVGVIYTTGS
jgi:dihydroneopterin aldolase